MFLLIIFNTDVLERDNLKLSNIFFFLKFLYISIVYLTNNNAYNFIFKNVHLFIFALLLFENLKIFLEINKNLL